ncbi:MAG: hypothetical protein LAP38_21745 [Acidobacteriia bacterium]|nr:hypothetical protein [Terriglobia bacterium]
MRAIGSILLLGTVLFLGTAPAQAPTFENVGTMSQLMIHVIYPASDALFYIEREPPKTDVQWNAIRMQALMVAESGNLLMMPGRARDDEWVKDAKLMVDAGAAAYKAALAKNMDAIVALSDQLTASCTTCHLKYRPNYRRSPLAQ